MRKIVKPKPKTKEVKVGLQEKEKNERKVTQVLVSLRKLDQRIKEGWRKVEDRGDLYLIEKEI